MNLERGFRRLVLTVSLAVAGAGLVVTAYDTYKTIRHVRATNEFVACSEEAEHRTPTAEDFTSLPEEWRPKIVPPEKLDDAERLKSWIEKARGYRQHLCGYILITLPVHFSCGTKPIGFHFGLPAQAANHIALPCSLFFGAS
jgi:hypothetical protein